MKPFETYTLDGCKVEYFCDTDAAPPWEREDGHGLVRTAPDRSDKRPGERILHQEGHTFWLYGWQEACKQARKDGWDAEPYKAPNRIERAVQADFDCLQGYLQNDWHYLDVQVTLGEETDSLWGIDSINYADTVAQELADNLNAQAQKEAAEAFHWACRDLATARQQNAGAAITASGPPSATARSASNETP